MHFSFSNRSGGNGPQRLPFLKYYNVPKWESRFTVVMNAAKNKDYIKQFFKQKLLRIKFPIKNSMDAYLYLLQEWS